MERSITASFAPEAPCSVFEFELKKQVLSRLSIQANQKILSKRTQLAKKIKLLKQKTYRRSKKKAENEAKHDLLKKLEEIDKVKNSLISNARVECLDLAISIAEEILNTQLDINIEAYQARLEKCLDTLSITKDLVVNVNPDKTAAASEIIKDKYGFKVQSDDSIKPGDIEVNLGSGKISFSWEEHLDLISNHLYEGLHVRNSKLL